jgi:hypothetical protein
MASGRLEIQEGMRHPAARDILHTMMVCKHARPPLTQLAYDGHHLGQRVAIEFKSPHIVGEFLFEHVC